MGQIEIFARDCSANQQQNQAFKWIWRRLISVLASEVDKKATRGLLALIK